MEDMKPPSRPTLKFGSTIWFKPNPPPTIPKRERDGCTDSFYKNTVHVLKLASLIGLNISVTNGGSIGNSTEADGFSPPETFCRAANFSSLPSLSNFLCFVSFFYMTIWIYLNLGGHLGLFFGGVDYYALAVDVISNFILATFLLFQARFKRKVLVKALNEIQQTYLCFKLYVCHFTGPKRMKYLSIGLVAFIITVTFLYGCLFLYLIFVLTYSYSCNNKDNWLTFSFIFQKLGHFCLPLYSLTFVALFVLTTETVRQFYIEMAFKLKCLLAPERILNVESIYMIHSRFKGGHHAPTKQFAKRKLAEELEIFRLTYERLRETVEVISEYFGVSLLMVCSFSVISITASIYTIILNQTEREIAANIKEDEQQEHIVGFFFILWLFHLFFALYNLGAILCCGQRVTDASGLVMKSVQQCSMSHLDEDSKFQISVLLGAIHGAPVEISACSITKMSMTFVASAVGNVITYILVLLQFKSSCSGMSQIMQK